MPLAPVHLAGIPHKDLAAPAPQLITTKYYVLITNANGCSSLGFVTITVDIERKTFFMLNAPSPNNDEKN